MTSPSHLWIKHRDLLQSVSRSFYLSIKFLPEEMRDPIALGYLLARLSDTVADAVEADAAQRVASLQEIRSTLGEPGSLLDLEIFSDSVNHPGEKTLLAAAPEVLDWFYEMEGPNRDLIQNVVSTIIDGQTWDVTFFQKSPEPGIPDAAQLTAYTYQVAGCVGEFWTEVGFANLGDDFADPRNRAEMLDQGKHYGQGLQLLNIIRDLHEDLPEGRCYLPVEDGRPDQKSIDKWLRVCRDYLEEGRHYLDHLQNRRVKFATALPLNIAEATAQELESVGSAGILRSKVKVSRNVVWKMMVKSAFSGGD